MAHKSQLSYFSPNLFGAGFILYISKLLRKKKHKLYSIFFLDDEQPSYDTPGDAGSVVTQETGSQPAREAQTPLSMHL